MPDPEEQQPEPVKTRKIVIPDSVGIPTGTMIATAEGMPDVEVRSRPWWLRTAVRVARVYVTTFVGLLPIVMGNMAPDYLRPPTDLMDRLYLTAGFSLSPAVVMLLSNLAEWLVREDAR